MTATAEQRYQLPSGDTGPGLDLLLERPVTITRLSSSAPQRLARALRGLPPTPWLRIRDAYQDEGIVVVVLPRLAGTLDEQLQAGVPARTAHDLTEMLEPTLSSLAALGLSVQSLDPTSVPVTEDGQPLLLPSSGTRPLAAEQAALLAQLGGPAPTGADDSADAPTAVGPSRPTRHLTPRRTPAAATAPAPSAGTTAPTNELPRPDVTAAPRYPRAGLTPAETGRRASTGRLRTGALALGAAAAVLGTGWVLTDRQTSTGEAGADRPAAAPAAQQPADPLGAVQSDLQADPTAAGAGGGDLLQRLRDTAGASGPQQAFAAAGTLEAIRVGRASAALQGPLVDRAAQAVTPIAAAGSLSDLVGMVEVDPAAFGPRTPKFLGRLTKLRDSLTGEAARTEAQDLQGIVRAGPAKGEFTPTFAAVALPVLTDLAVPKDLTGLLSATSVEPARFGPRTPKFAGRLAKLQSLTGEAAVVEATDLVAIVETGVGKGEFTAAFRDIALPVLRPIAAGTAS